MLNAARFFVLWVGCTVILWVGISALSALTQTKPFSKCVSSHDWACTRSVFGE